jgi:hypothetical protein
MPTYSGAYWQRASIAGCCSRTTMVAWLDRLTKFLPLVESNDLAVQYGFIRISKPFSGQAHHCQDRFASQQRRNRRGAKHGAGRCVLR